MQAPEQTVTRDQLIEQVWLGNQAVGSKALTNAIYRLRKQLNSDDAEAIRTIAKTGYQLLLPVSIESTSIVPRSSLLTRQRRSIWPIVLGCVLMVVGLTLFATYRYLPQEPSQQTMEVKPLTFLDGIEEHPAFSHDGNFLAFSWQKKDAISQIFIKDLRSTTAPIRQISYGSNDELYPVWSPDDKQIAYIECTDPSHCKILIKSLDTLATEDLGNIEIHNQRRTLDWSADGTLLALIDQGKQGNSAVFKLDLASKTRTQLTFPNADYKDTQVAFAHHSNRLAFVRKVATQQDLYLLESDGSAKRLTFDNAPIYGAAWSYDDKFVIINSMRQGRFSLWKVDVTNGATTLFHRDNTPVSLAASNQGMFAYSKHMAHDKLIALDQTALDKPLFSVQSNGRDMYGSWSPLSQQILFISNRSGPFEVWMVDADGNNFRQLTHQQGVPGVPAWSPINNQFAVPLTNGNRSDLYLGNSSNGEWRRLTNDNYQYRNVSWSDDGEHLLINSNRGGQWEIWRYHIASETFEQLTHANAIFAREFAGNLYFTKEGQPGLWTLNSGNPELVAEGLAAKDWGNWFATDEGIIYVTRGVDTDQLVLESSDGQEVLGTYPAKRIRGSRSISFNSKRQLLLGVTESNTADIMALVPATAP